MDELHDRIVTTRKPHLCAWCPEIIEAKTKAASRAYVWEGDFHHDYFHPECRDAMHRSEDLEDGFTLHEQKRGQAVNYYGEPIALDPIPITNFMPLTTGM